ncbi:MAG: hypothetical protein HY040_03390 [Planctomycetes bacterium]|nr:hypothetical protein [Planctomycetota bacterium]
MTHKLILDVPDEVFQPLATRAKRTGNTPEQTAIEWLLAFGMLAAQDPLEDLIGSLRGGTADWADQHDKYLGQSQLDPNGANPNVGN